MAKIISSKNHAKVFSSKNIQPGRFYGNRSDIKKSAKKTEIQKTDGNSLMAKGMAPKSLTMMTLSVQVQ